jgi:hypothetical protein
MMFDAEATLAGKEQPNYGPLPAGWYDATINGFVMKTSQTGNEYLNVEYQTDKGRVWDIMNIKHAKDQVRNIAMEQLARLCLAAGFRSIKNPENPDELIGQKVRILVEVDGTYNRVKAVEKVEGTPQESAQKLYGASPAPATDDVDDEIPF